MYIYYIYIYCNIMINQSMHIICHVSRAFSMVVLGRVEAICVFFSCFFRLMKINMNNVEYIINC